MRRDGMGRILGGVSEWFNHYNSKDDNWEDYKVSEVRFPQHGQNIVYPVVTYNISELNLHKV